MSCAIAPIRSTWPFVPCRGNPVLRIHRKSEIARPLDPVFLDDDLAIAHALDVVRYAIALLGHDQGIEEPRVRQDGVR